MPLGDPSALSYAGTDSVAVTSSPEYVSVAGSTGCPCPGSLPPVCSAASTMSPATCSRRSTVSCVRLTASSTEPVLEAPALLMKLNIS